MKAGKVEEQRKQKNIAYHERNQLVAALSKVYPSWMGQHPDEDQTWDDDWRWIVFVNGPTGQMSWHIHDFDLPLFDHIKERYFSGSEYVPPEKQWDGHSTPEKYKRLRALPVLRQGHDDE